MNGTVLGFRPKEKGGNRGPLSKIFQNGHLQYKHLQYGSVTLLEETC